MNIGPPIDNDPTTLITEFAKRGDLNTLLNKVGRYIFRDRDRKGRTGIRDPDHPYQVADEKERIPVVVIWQIFDCRVFYPRFLCLCFFSFAALSLPPLLFLWRSLFPLAFVN